MSFCIFLLWMSLLHILIVNEYFLYIPTVNEFVIYFYRQWVCYIFFPWMSLLYIFTMNELAIYLYRELLCYIFLLAWMSLLYILNRNELAIYSYRKWVFVYIPTVIEYFYLSNILYVFLWIQRKYWSRCLIQDVVVIKEWRDVAQNILCQTILSWRHIIGMRGKTRQCEQR